MKWPSRYVLKHTALVTLIAAGVSISVSTGIRVLVGAEADTVTIVVRLVLPFVIAIPLGLIWFSKLEQLDRSYRGLVKEASELARRAGTDPLTGLLNRRSFAEQFDSALAHGIRGIFVIADIDYLKAINDRHGHLAGDDAILATTHALQTVLGEGALIARIGGDEFCAFLSHGDAADIERRLARVSDVAGEDFRRRVGPMPTGEPPSLTVSAGSAVCRSDATFRTMIARTDSKLYRKKQGREVA